MPSRRRALSGPALVGVGLATVLSVLAADSAVAFAAPPATPRPKAEGWTPWSHWVGNADGTVTRTVFPDLTFHTGPDGRWAPVDAEVVEATDAHGPDAASVPGAVRPMTFGRAASSLLRVELDGGDVTLSAPALKVDRPSVTPTDVTYVAPDAHALMRFTVSTSGVKQEITLADRTAPTRYRFRLADPEGVLGDAVPTGDGGYRFDKPVADGLYLTIPAPYAYEQGKAPETELDADGEVVPSARLRVTKRGNGFDIVEAVDADWLKGKSFPVVLDPSLSYSGASRVTDCAISSAATALTTPECGTAQTQVGSDASSSRRLLLRYDVSGFPSPAQVTAASVVVTSGAGSSFAAELREPGSAWTTGATWLTSDGSTSWGVGTPGGAPGSTVYGTATLASASSRSFTSPALASLVAGWINGSAQNKGLLLKAQTESVTTGFNTLATTEHTTPTSWPALQITYSAPPDIPGSPVATRGDQSATVSWTAPADNGSAITGYTVKAYDGATLVATTTAAAGATSKVVTGLTNGTSYTFTITATNAIGTSDPATTNAVTPAGVPFAPAGVVATRGDQSASVSWTAANPNGSPVTGHTVRAYAGATLVSTTGTGAGTSATVTGLTNGTAYTFTVTATNDVGTSAASAASTAVTPAGLPFVPTGVAAVPGNGAATVTWTAANGNGATVTGNTVSAYAGATLVATASAGAVTSATVTGLTNGVSYTFKVRATNDVGTGADSAASAAVVAGTPGTPAGVTATRGDQSASVTWTAPAANGGAISGYAVKAYTGSTLVSTTNVGAVTSATVTGLVNGTAYTFRVTASNTYGAGPESAPSNAVTPAGTPFAPTNVTATAADTTATVTWTAASANGSPVTGYTVETYAGATKVATQNVSAATTSATTTGLTNGTAYHFTVAATNSVGTGAATTSNTVTPAGVPSAPGNVVATGGDTALTVTWSAASPNGAAVTGYTVKTYTGATLVSTTTAAGNATSKTVTGLTNGTAHYVTVTATNAVGTSSAATSNTVTPAGAPFAPTGVTATRGDSSAVVSWTAPGSNGSAITGYVVKAYAGATLVSTTNVNAPSTSTTVTGLANGTAYTFTVAATNAAGTGPASAASNAVTPAGTPFAPSGVTATGGDSQAGVSWTAPSANGSAITGYVVRTYAGATLVRTDNAGAVTSTTVPGLTNGTSYTFTVAATNAIGTGAASAASNAVVPAGVPFAPTNVSAEPGNAAAVVSWTAPGGNGSAVTGYTIRAYVGATLAQTATVGAPATTATVTGLTNGTTYTVKVAATNSAGTGAESAASGAVTAGVPGVPTGVSVAPGDASAVVSWTAPASNGGPITGYTVKAYQNGSVVTTASAGGSATTVAVTGLTNGASYTFTVTAANAYGSGRETAQTAAVTPAGAPLAPPNVTATDGDQSATVTWGPAAANGSAITGYVVKAYAGATLVSTNNTGPGTTSLTVSSLANGTAYTFTVAAVNAVGTGAPGTSGTVTPAGVPFQPGSLTVTPGDTTLALTWTAASSNGAVLTAYRITVRNPDGTPRAPFDVDAAATQTTITGLTNGAAYDVEVAGVNRAGTGAAATVFDATPLISTAPASAGHYVPLTPARVVDTRSGLGGSETPLTGGQFQTFTLTGVGGVPDSGVSAVAVSVTGVLPTNASYLTVWPTGRARPQVSMVTMPANFTTAGLTIARLGPNGQVNVYLNAGTADVVMDVQGYYTDGTATTGGGRFAAVTPQRVVDTATGLGNGTNGTTPIAALSERSFTIAGTDVPSTGVSAVAIAVTAMQSTWGGHLTVFRNGDTRPGTSNLNFGTGQTVTTLVEVAVDADRKVVVYNGSSGTTAIRIDVQGYYTTGTGAYDVFVPVNPNRIYNSTSGQGNNGVAGTLASGDVRSVLVAGATDPGGANVIPPNATAAVLSVQAATPGAAGFLQGYPSGIARPATGAIVNYGNAAGTSYTATYVAKVGADGRVNVYASNGPVGLVIDVMGYFQPGAPAAPLTPTISSSHYVENAWPPVLSSGATFTFGNASLDVDHYLYALDDPALSSPSAAYPSSGTNATITMPPPGGWRALYVQAVDSQNEVSPIRKFVFGSSPGISSPATGSTSQGVVSLDAAAPSNVTGITWKYRRGSSETFGNLPVADVTNGTSAVAAWPVSTPAAGIHADVPALTWNAATTLGLDGAAELQACFTYSTGTACETRTATIRLDRGGDTNPTATTPFGPGTLNLATGNLALGATDASVTSFASDLTVARSYNTGSPVRAVPGAAEHLNGYQSDIEGTSGANDFTNIRVTTAAVTTPVFSQSKALRINPAATGLSNETYVAVGKDTNNGMQLGLEVGHSYTLTTYVYVPSTTGLASGVGVHARADKAVAFWSGPGGIGGEAATNAPTATNVWQKLTTRFTVAAGSTQTFVRLYNGRPTADMVGGSTAKPIYYDKTSITDEGVFGPGWVPSLPVGSADSAYSGLVDYGTQVHVHDSDGAVIVFAKNSAGAFAPTGDDATSGLVLKPATITNGTAATWTLTDLDGNSTVFVVSAKTAYPSAPSTAAPHAYRVSRVTQPGSALTTTYTYDLDGRVTEMLAPVPAGVSCTGGLWGKGCRALQFTYNTSGHLTAVAYKSADTSGGAFVVAVSCYAYDEGLGTGNTGRLLQQWDPRAVTSGGVSPTCGSPVLPTTYGYTGGRLTSITPPGQVAVVLGYDGAGRVETSTRTPSSGAALVSTARYGVPATPDAGNPALRPDLSPTTVATWGQAVAPVTGVAVFAPGSGTPSATDVREAAVHYLDAGARVVNTASYGGGWHVDTTEYDEHGNVVRTLDAANRALALAAQVNDPQDLDLPGTSVARAAALSTVNVYSDDGMDLTDTYGPYHVVTLPGGAGVDAVRTHTHTDYDTGAELAHPAGPTLHLEVSSYTAASRSVVASPTLETDRVTTLTKYALSSSDATGWTFRKPMQVIVDPDGLALSTVTRYDATTGLPVESRMPSNPTGGAAGSTQQLYYTAGATSPDADCRNRPEWVNLLCKEVPAAQPVSDGTTAGLAGRSTKWMQSYDYLSRPTAVVESPPGAAARTVTTTYENSGFSPRVSQRAVSGGIGAAQPTVTTTYHASTGLVATVSSSATTENTARTSSTGYDDLGRVTSYDDDTSDSVPATGTVYDDSGRVFQVTDHKGVRTYTYDEGTENRGLVTKVVDTPAGQAALTFTATYDAEGRIATETWPNGLTRTVTHDTSGEAVRLRVVHSGGSVWLDESVSPDAHGRWRTRSASMTPFAGSLGGSWTYDYDKLGRLTSVTDDPSGAAGCTTRTYGFDANSNRTRSTTYAPAGDGTCQTGTGTSVTHRYDTADRLLAIGADAGLTYDAYGRVTTLPASGTADPANGAVQMSYYASDLVRSVTRGTLTQRWTLDPAGRLAARTDLTGGSPTGTVTNHYTDSSDSPGWVAENAAGTQWTRNVEGIDGSLAVTADQAGALSFKVANLHGDVVAVSAGLVATRPATGYAADEYGVPQGATPGRYGWLGAKQRAADVLGGLTLMGVRLYAPMLGRFLQVDPVPGGNANAYTYPLDPVNEFDLDGRKKCGRFDIQCKLKKVQWKKVFHSVATVSFYAGSALNIAGNFGCTACLAAGAMLQATSAGIYLAVGDRRAAGNALGSMAMGLTGGVFGGILGKGLTKGKTARDAVLRGYNLTKTSRAVKAAFWGGGQAMFNRDVWKAGYRKARERWD